MKIAIIVLALAAAALADIVVVDNTQPVVVIDRPTTALPAYTSENQSVSVKFNFTEQNPNNYSITIFNTSIVVCSKYANLTSGGTNITINDTCTLSGARNSYNFSIRVNITDVLGNTSSNTQTNAVILDVVAPVVSGEIPLNNSNVTSSPVTFSVNTSETAECRYATGSGADFDSMTTFANTNSTAHSVNLALTDFGSYSFYVRCQDAAFNRNPDYFTKFYYTGSIAYFGRSVSMDFALNIGGDKSDDTVKRAQRYATLSDAVLGTVFAVVFSGSSPFTSTENSAYSATENMVGLIQSANDNRFIIAYPKGSDATITPAAPRLGGMKIPSKTFHNYAETKPDAIRIYMVLQYTNLHLTGRESWRGAGKLLIKNRGAADDGLSNITIEVV
ncbi:MAG: hypothetical protein HYW27_01445 [Candidatus Aenigmarchaeota archaeon]|nr:hypothetical protein [Candidatus Aenigmarchaeota archaeon]